MNVSWVVEKANLSKSIIVKDGNYKVQFNWHNWKSNEFPTFSITTCARATMGIGFLEFLSSYLLT